MRLFFYGTLIDDEVRRLVVGAAVAVTSARVIGFRRVVVAGRDYPMLRHRAGRRVEGVLTGPLAPEAIRRLRFYEGREYRLRPIQVECGPEGRVTAAAFFCPPGVAADHREWRLDQWRRRGKRAALRRIAALMRTLPPSAMPR